MLDFIRSNLVTIITVILLAAAVALAIGKLIRDKKKGIGSCGCKCSDCPMSGKCNK